MGWLIVLVKGGNTMPEQPLLSIPLDIANVRILQTDVTKSGEFIITVESTLSRTICRRCGRTLSEQHGVERPRLLRHLPKSRSLEI